MHVFCRPLQKAGLLKKQSSFLQGVFIVFCQMKITEVVEAFNFFDVVDILNDLDATINNVRLAFFVLNHQFWLWGVDDGILRCGQF